MNLFKVIPFGIGKYFLSFIGMIIIFLIVVSLTGAAVYYTGINLIGNVFTQEQITGALSSTQDMKAFIDSLSLDQLIKLNLWNYAYYGGNDAFIFYFYALGA